MPVWGGSADGQGDVTAQKPIAATNHGMMVPPDAPHRLTEGRLKGNMTEFSQLATPLWSPCRCQFEDHAFESAVHCCGTRRSRCGNGFNRIQAFRRVACQRRWSAMKVEMK